MTEARRADLAYFASIAVALALLGTLGALQRHLELIGNDDLARILTGPQALLRGADPYDPATWPATVHALGTLAPDTPVYIYPPWVAVVMLPIATLALPVATIGWLAASLVAGVAGLRALLRTYLPGRPLMHAAAAAMLLLSWTGALSLILGQWAFLLIAAQAAVILLLRRDRPVPAGVAAVALIVKPQLFVLTAPAIAVRSLWPAGTGGGIARAGVRFIITAFVTTAAIVAVSWVVLPSWWPTWLVLIGAVQLGPDSDTVPGLLFALFAERGPAFAPLVMLPLILVALRFHPRSEAWLPVWLTLSLVVAPYTNSYDQILLVVPIVQAAGVVLRRSVRRASIVLGAGAFLLIGVTPVMYELAIVRHSETFGVLVPLAAFAVIVVALWPQASASAAG